MAEEKDLKSEVMPKKRASRLVINQKILLIAGLVIVVAAVATSWYFYTKSKDIESQLNNPDASSQKVIDETVKRVGKLILLPQGEQPTLATVKDVEKVKSQPFFNNAAYGDKVLVYTQARKAILYRPNQDIIIEVAPLNIDTNL